MNVQILVLPSGRLVWASVEPDQDLDVHARASVLDRPQIAAVAPARAGEEGAVHHDSRSPGAPPRP